MKKCPKCGQTYDDNELNFCYNDGELLSFLANDASNPERIWNSAATDDSPPTEFLNSPRITQGTGWNPPHAPPVAWQSNQPVGNPEAQPFPTSVLPNQNLAVISLLLGVGSMTIGWCCGPLGILMSPAAIITGIIALSQIKRDPQRNAGRGFAISGIIIGSVFMVLYLLFIILYGLAAFWSSFPNG